MSGAEDGREDEGSVRAKVKSAAWEGGRHGQGTDWGSGYGRGCGRGHRSSDCKATRRMAFKPSTRSSVQEAALGPQAPARASTCPPSHNDSRMVQALGSPHDASLPETQPREPRPLSLQGPCWYLARAPPSERLCPLGSPRLFLEPHIRFPNSIKEEKNPTAR